MTRTWTNLARADIFAGNNLSLTNTTLVPVGAPWPPAAAAIIAAAGVRP
jgi:hypothetical protein